MSWHPPVLDALNGPVSLVVIILCIFICYYLNSRNISVLEVGDSPVQVIDKKEYWRCFTSSFSHYSILHIVFNVSTLWELIPLENYIGSVYYLIYITILAFFAPLTDSIIRRKFMPDKNPYSIGISAVGFGLMTIIQTIQSYLVIFGFRIPWSIMPFISCIFTSILIPEASFIGHLSGIIIGYLIRWHVFDWVTPKLYFNIMPWIIVLTLLNYKKSYRNRFEWLQVSKTAPPRQSRLEGGVLIPE